MELAFQTSRLSFLKQILREVRCQEETAETIVPDTCPDMAAIIDSWAEPMLRGKDCRDGSVIVSGGIKGGVLYTPEDGSHPRCLDFYIPFTMKLEHAALTEHAQILCVPRIRSVDGRMVNSRKAMLRVNLCCRVTAYEQAEQTLHKLQSKPDAVQVRIAEYPLELPLETAERSFVLEEDLDLPTGRPPAEQICKFSCRLELTEQKVIANKAVFKGVANCKILYCAEDATHWVYRQQLPFSQYCELAEDYDQERVLMYPVITGMDHQLTNGGNGVTVTMHGLVQCVIFGNRPLTVIEDAYATQGDLETEWVTYDLEGCLDRQRSIQTVSHTLRGDLRQILDFDFYPDEPVIRQGSDGLRIETPVSMHVLGSDSNGKLTALTGRGEATREIVLAKDAVCDSSITQIGFGQASDITDGAELRCELCLESSCKSNQNIRNMAEATIKSAENAKRNPSIILQYADADMTLWELAKQHRSKEDAIRSANHLDSDRIAEKQMLLIPVG